ncbi:DUF4232 domain-containing protein [Amycolatopsis acidiphila]|nr:DUF4232 domain-containing protein [Amycolatopsis acidiphila]UIJ57483.1 DUF4232 domain-containing protein [Amycolatopsis acidiphila]GHG96345.1 hypothetical protein GCM10017788_75360 [Amycolatopsis acidiphila]
MKTIQRAATATIAGGIAAGSLLLAGGTASAMPSDEPCGVSDVHITVTPEAAHAAGQEAYLITYTAAAPTTNCRLDGVPTGLSFVSGGQNNASDTTVTPDAPGAVPVPVNLTAGHPAESRILQDAAAPVTFLPDALNLNLPTGPDGSSTTVAWPAGAPLKGTTARVTAVAPADAS